MIITCGFLVVFYCLFFCLTSECLDLFKFTDIDVKIAVASKFQVDGRFWRETLTLDRSLFCLSRINNFFKKVQTPPLVYKEGKLKPRRQ